MITISCTTLTANLAVLTDRARSVDLSFSNKCCFYYQIVLLQKLFAYLNFSPTRTSVLNPNVSNEAQNFQAKVFLVDPLLPLFA